MKKKHVPVLIAAAASVLGLCPAANAALAGAVESAVPGVNTMGLGFDAALTMGLCVMGSAYAVGRIGSAALGAAAEKPELLIRSLLFVALAEGLAVLGFVISMMLLRKM